MSNAPAGWYDDGSGSRRWWNGAAWTADIEPKQLEPVDEPPKPGRATGPLRKGLAIAALCVGAVAFLAGLVPVFGILAGVTGVVLGLIAYAKRQPKVLVVTGLALAGLGAAASVGMTVGVSTVSNNDLVAASAPTESAVVEAEPEEMKPEPSSTPKPKSTAEKKAEKTEKPKKTEKAEKRETVKRPEAEKSPGPSDKKKSKVFDRALKDGLGVSESYQEVLSVDPKLWAGHVVGVRVEGGDAYVTLQVDRNTPDGKDLGERAAQAISTLILQETVDSLGLSWVIVEDGTGTVIDQKTFAPFF